MLDRLFEVKKVMPSEAEPPTTAFPARVALYLTLLFPSDKNQRNSDANQ
jgi:hypothetical protein